MKRLLAVTAIALLSAAPAAAAPGASVSGSGTVFFGNTIEHIAVSARQVAGTEATGHAMINNATANVRVHVDVNCLNVIGNYAIVSGIVTRTSDPTAVPEGTQAIFAVLDAGNGGRDFASIANFYPVGIGPDCTVPSEFDLAPVRGNFRVDPA